MLNDGVRGNDNKEERWANTKSLQADKLNNVNLISFFSLYFCLKFWGCGNYFKVCVSHIRVAVSWRCTKYQKLSEIKLENLTEATYEMVGWSKVGWVVG